MPQESLIDAAIEYLEQGLSIIPIRPDTKRPAIRWKEYQTRQPTHEEVEQWFTTWPDANIAVVTGEVSGIVIVDCDNDEALSSALSCDMRSPIRVSTKRVATFGLPILVMVYAEAQEPEVIPLDQTGHALMG